MELLDGIMTTRAIRRFTGEPVTREEIETCLRAAQQGPSGGNIQPWQFVVVTDGEVKRALSEVYKRAYDRYEPALMASLPPFRSPGDEAAFMRAARASRYLADHLDEAAALILVAMPDISMTLADDEGPLDVGTPYASVYPAVQNLMLAARDLGIGTALTTVYRIYQDEVRRICGIPGRYEIVALVPMGRPRGKFGVARRRPAESVTHWDQWGSRDRADGGFGGRSERAEAGSLHGQRQGNNRERA